MGLLWDSFWRAAAYCVLPRVIALSLLPLALIAMMAWGVGHFAWTPMVAWVQQAIDPPGWWSMVWEWLPNFGLANAPSAMAPLAVLMAVLPLIVAASVLAVALLMAPALLRLVAQRRFPSLARKSGGSVLASIAWSAGTTLAALAALLVSMPLWLIPPLALVLPPLIWGWLTYRVMAYDALAEHASKEERLEIFKRYRLSLLGIGIVCGYLSAAPGIVWASAVVFAAAFLVLMPVAIWIYTLVFAFSSLWFTHFALAALSRLRQEQNEPDAAPAGSTHDPLPAPALADASTPPSISCTHSSP